MNLSGENCDHYDRVTSVLSPFSGLSFIKKEVLENAGARGTVVHAICTAIICNQFYSPEWIEELVRKYAKEDAHYQHELKLVNNFVISFEKWNVDKFGSLLLGRFYNKEHEITGECDFIYKDSQGKMILVDLKTPLKSSSTWPLQGSAYSYMAKQYGYPVEEIHFVKLCREGSTPEVFVYQENFGLFLETLHVYRYFYKEKKFVDVSEYV